MMQGLMHVRKHWSTTWKFDASARTKGMISSPALLNTFTDGTSPNTVPEDILRAMQFLTSDKKGAQAWPE